MCKCGNNCSNNCCSDEKYFTSQINYDGPKVECIGTITNINPPYTSLNSLLQQVMTKLCALNEVAAQGVGISSIDWTSNSGAQPQGTQGTTDTYTITLTDASTWVFLVTNGADGVDGANGLDGAPGDAFSFDIVNGSIVTLTGTAAGASSVGSTIIRCAKNGKFNMLNIYIALSVTGGVGETLGVDIDISAYLANGMATNFYNVVSFDKPSPYNPPIFSRAIALNGIEKITINTYELPSIHTADTVYVLGQISFYEL